MTDAFTAEINRLWEGCHVGTDHVGRRQLVSLKKSKRDKILKREYYDKQIETAKKIVAKENLLIYNVKDGWDPLCKFLHKPIPDKLFPRINSTKELTEWIYDYKKKRFIIFLKDKLCNVYVLLAMFVLVLAYAVQSCL